MARAPALQEMEELPEADRLEGYPHPRETRALYGHEAAERVLAEEFATGRLHHGWLIEGPEGVGKATLAYRFATFLLADAQDRDPFGGSLHIEAETPAARQIRARAHPGLLVLRRPYDTKSKRFAATIPIDEVRRLRGFLGLTADAGSWRVVIVDTADELNVNAANALLKSLEEPPRQTVFLLLTAEPGRLLSTIRSRCRTLSLHALAPEPLRKAVAQAVASSGEESTASLPSGADWKKLEELSGGSARRVLGLMAAGGVALYDRILKHVSALPRPEWGGLHALGDELASPAAEQRLELFYELFLALLARLIRASATGAGSESDLALARRLIPEERLSVWAEAWEALLAEKTDALTLNLDRKSLILDAFARLEAAARPS